MSAIRKTYHSIRFPISDTSFESVFALYYAEFGISGEIEEHEVVILFANALRDYLADLLPEDAFAAVCFALITRPDTGKLLGTKLLDLRSVILDCVDIAWLSKSSYFDEFRLNLSRVLESLNDT